MTARSKKNGNGYSKQRKFHNTTTVIDGIKFASRAEAQYYVDLKEKEARGLIRSFRIQPRFILQESFKKGNKTFRQIEYVADFEVVENDGTVRIIEVKGFETDTWKIKRKLFEYRYPDLNIEVVFTGRKKK